MRPLPAPAAAALALTLLSGVALAQPTGEVVLRGTVDDAPAQARVRSAADGLVVELDHAWRGEAVRLGQHVWRADLRRPAPRDGVADRLPGGAAQPEASAERLSFTYLTVPGLPPRAQVTRDGRGVGLLEAEGPPLPALEPAPADALAVAPPRFSDAPLGEPRRRCRPVRDRWWSRLPVAGWETARSLWGFVRGDRGEALRGRASPAETRTLRERLEATAPRPWRAATIYRAARELTTSDRDALRLAFALCVDDPDLPVRQLPGIGPEVPRHDKYKHFFASAILAHRSNRGGSLAVGWLKEVYDEVRPGGSGYSPEDLVADTLGAEFGQALLCGQVLEY